MSAGEPGTEPSAPPVAASAPARAVEVVTPASSAATPAPVLPAASQALGVPPPAGPLNRSAADVVRVNGNRALAEVLYQVRRVGAATVAGIAAVVLAVTLYVANNLPQGGVIASLKAQLAHLASPAAGAKAITAPPAAMLSSLPARDEGPEIVAKIVEEARASGVELPRGQYEYVPARDGVAASYRMTFPVHATYPQLREFMDRTLVALPAVAVEGMRIERKTVGDEGVDAELKFSAFVRSEP